MKNLSSYLPYRSETRHYVTARRSDNFVIVFTTEFADGRQTRAFDLPKLFAARLKNSRARRSSRTDQRAIVFAIAEGEISAPFMR